ncbi:MAG: hypothetical protein RLZZ440_687 [Planctomycetota bacterium]
MISTASFPHELAGRSLAYASESIRSAPETIVVSRADILIQHAADDVEATVLLRRITGDPEETALWDTLAKAVDDAAARRVTLDFRNVQHISSLGIGQLVSFARSCRDKHAGVVIRDLCPSLEQVFRLMRLDAFVEIDRSGAAGGGGTP